MAFAIKSSVNSAALSGRVTRRAAAPRSVQVRAGADRPLWMPGNPAPAHLDGSLAGDYGFDPLNLGSDERVLKWMVEAELQHARWAMMGVAGILFVSIGAQAGAGYPQWYDAGEVAIKNSPMPLGTMIITQILLMQWAELRRGQDFQKAGSMADGSFLGVTEEFKGKMPGYPGGKYFDPLGMSEGPEFEVYKQKEIKNGRLAMVAFVGFAAQHAATGKGPIENLVDHLASPYTTTFATNGVSVPFLPQ